MDRSDEGGDPACWAHLLFEEAPGAVADGPDSEPAPTQDGAAPATNQKPESRTAM